MITEKRVNYVLMNLTTSNKVKYEYIDPKIHFFQAGTIESQLQTYIVVDASLIADSKYFTAFTIVKLLGLRKKKELLFQFTYC